MLNLERTRFISTGFFLMTATAVWSGQAEETLNAGLKLHEAGKPKEAIREYDRAIKANPKLAEAYFNRGNAYYDLRQTQQALRDYSEAIRVTPKGAQRSHNRGNTSRRLPQYE